MASALGTGSLGGGNRTAIEAPSLTWCAGSRIVRPSIAISPARISALRRQRDNPVGPASARSSRCPSSRAATTMVCVASFDMADPSPDKPDQPAAAEGRKPEDAAERLNEILSSPIENPFGSGGNPEGEPETKPAAVPPDFAGWQGAR